MKVLVVGLGQLGSALSTTSWPDGLKIVGKGHADLDIADQEAVRREMTEGYGLVVNAAAYTAVDNAEHQPDEAWRANAIGPRNIASACAATSIPMIHVSTDYVFDGTKEGAYRVDDTVHPINVYGKSKEAGEQAVRSELGQHIILRTAWLYSDRGSNFVRTILRLLDERDELQIVADQKGAPTSAADLAAAIVSIAEQLLLKERSDAWGTYHMTNSGNATWFELARAIADWRIAHARRSSPIRPITTKDYPTPARRPANSVLDCSKLNEVFSVSPRPWRQALADTLMSLHRES